MFSTAIREILTASTAQEKNEKMNTSSYAPYFMTHRGRRKWCRTWFFVFVTCLLRWDPTSKLSDRKVDQILVSDRQTDRQRDSETDRRSKNIVGLPTVVIKTILGNDIL